MTAATLRAARPTDAGALGAMITAAAQANAWKPRLHSAAQDIAHAGEMIDRGWVTVAEQANRPLAFLAREDSYIHALFVTPDAQGRGLGTALLRRAKRHAPRLDLWTFADNHGARRFYRREGFVPTQRPPASDEGLPEIHLTWLRDAAAPTPVQQTEAFGRDAATPPPSASTQTSVPAHPDKTAPRQHGTAPSPRAPSVSSVPKYPGGAPQERGAEPPSHSSSPASPTEGHPE